MREIRLRVSDEIYYRILLLMEQNSSSKNALINSALLEFLDKDKSDQFLDNNAQTKLNHKIQIPLSDDEYNLLKNRAKSHGFSSVRKECRYQVINSLYDEQFLNNCELKEFKTATAKFNKVSKDLFELISPLFEDLMSPGNELMENMNRLRLYMKEFMDFANKEMAEGQ